MSTPVIRPFNPPAAQPTQTPASRPAAEARAAQRAFFQQAVGDQTPVRAPATLDVRAPNAPTATRNIVRPLPDEKPQRILRPGSFVDIKI